MFILIIINGFSILSSKPASALRKPISAIAKLIEKGCQGFGSGKSYIPDNNFWTQYYARQSMHKVGISNFLHHELNNKVVALTSAVMPGVDKSEVPSIYTGVIENAENLPPQDVILKVSAPIKEILNIFRPGVRTDFHLYKEGEKYQIFTPTTNAYGHMAGTSEATPCNLAQLKQDVDFDFVRSTLEEPLNNLTSYIEGIFETDGMIDESNEEEVVKLLEAYNEAMEVIDTNLR